MAEQPCTWQDCLRIRWTWWGGDVRLCRDCFASVLREFGARQSYYEPVLTTRPKIQVDATAVVATKRGETCLRCLEREYVWIRKSAEKQLPDLASYKGPRWFRVPLHEKVTLAIASEPIPPVYHGPLIAEWEIEAFVTEDEAFRYRCELKELRLAAELWNFRPTTVCRVEEDKLAPEWELFGALVATRLDPEYRIPPGIALGGTERIWRLLTGNRRPCPEVDVQPQKVSYRWKVKTDPRHEWLRRAAGAEGLG